MSESQSEDARRKSRLRWITLGEAIAIAALIVSAAGVWLSWQGADEMPPTTTIIEKQQSIPLALRGKAEDDGRSLTITPVEAGHALQSLTITPSGGTAIEVGSDGELEASALMAALAKTDSDEKGTQRVRAQIAARYIEAGADKSAKSSYVITYRWEGGGLFGGRSLRLTGIARA
ncbi:hypothetical protein GCM10023264_29890 [Sphingomonas daechungensis]|uniref:Uncharacterized protein n=1 Tax=Sphingomonas daechungensis TaxID=1176646 RepID=A0ABX6SY55_9SPHN|nr:hypothetical protein [Sphingomonas daechungensis]QNP42517.1 hypothetical protein H9L15_09650 [Sphingomonas daechungensis]